MSETLFIHQNSVLNKRDAFLQQKQVSEPFYFISMFCNCMVHSLLLMTASHRDVLQEHGRYKFLLLPGLDSRPLPTWWWVVSEASLGVPRWVPF